MCPIGEQRTGCQSKKKSEINAPRHTTRSRQTTTRVDESESLRCSARAAASLFFYLVAQDRKPSLSGCLEGAEEALKCHVRNSSGDAAIEVSSVCSVFSLDCSVSMIVGRSSRPKTMGLRPPLLTFEAPTTGYDILWCVGVGEAIESVPYR